MLVNGSEMPKGVEHEILAKGGHLRYLVNGSEMPKGVEHEALSLHICDA